MKAYKDLFVDFDDTLYDTHGNAVIALRETFDAFKLAQYFDNPQTFYDAYWAAKKFYYLSKKDRDAVVAFINAI